MSWNDYEYLYSCPKCEWQEYVSESLFKDLKGKLCDNCKDLIIDPLGYENLLYDKALNTDQVPTASNTKYVPFRN